MHIAFTATNQQFYNLSVWSVGCYMSPKKVKLFRKTLLLIYLFYKRKDGSYAVSLVELKTTYDKLYTFG
jgi:hypothetical protein